MTKEKDDLIPLQIKGVRIASISIRQDTAETLPRIDIGVQLIMENNEPLTTINLCNASWIDEDKRLDLDVEVFEMIARVEKIVVPAIHRTLNRQQRTLENK